ncbi:CD225/dispanin family protein [Gaoshiqia sediminis]|uniref:CD225/dispanin family protein n=1 Tax=Gaoshiqia sediminis TaxID=2986998 RepID=A0AA41Y3Y5_9BACT|nr:CD225/dispanin family protein [Gaoshiqia sediminis]MCW0482999.1 CD225/dispanin family protein [Gaoshiqia sediminis]
MENQTVNQKPPKTWLVESILVTILCCLPFGIVGIVNAAKVESRFYAGDIAGAERASSEAGKWTKIGFFIGIAVILIYIILMVLGVAAGIMAN